MLPPSPATEVVVSDEESAPQASLTSVRPVNDFDMNLSDRLQENFNEDDFQESEPMMDGDKDCEITGISCDPYTTAPSSLDREGGGHGEDGSPTQRSRTTESADIPVPICIHEVLTQQGHFSASSPTSEAPSPQDRVILALSSQVARLVLPSIQLGISQKSPERTR